MPLWHANGLSQGINLIGSHQAGMVVFMTLKRQTPTFDRIGDEQFRSIIQSRLLKRLHQGFKAVATQLRHQIRERSIVIGADQGLAFRRQILQQTLPPSRTTLIAQRRIKVVWAGFDPSLKRLTARFGKCFQLSLAIFER